MDDVRVRYALDDDKILATDSTRIRRGYRRQDGKRVVLKVPRSEYPSAADVAMIRHEHALLTELASAPVAQALDLVRFDNEIGLVLEDVGVRSFDQLIAAGVDLRRFLRLARLAAETVATIHARGILHKDVKPQHFFCDEGEERVVLIDFGIATTISQEEQRPQSLDSLEGTLAYMSPEQTGRMNRAVDRRSDLYSLGVTLYQLLTGTLPFDTTDPLELVHCHIARSPRTPADVPAIVSQIVMRLLEKVAEARYQTAAGLAFDLEHCEQLLDRGQSLEPFRLGEQDHSSELCIPQKLYGREGPRAQLQGALARAKGGARELVLLRGSSGIGKSALVHELYKEVTFGGNLVFGKFDQFNRSVPYAAVAAACRELVRAELASPKVQLDAWRARVLEALGDNGRLLTDVIPELELVVGPRPPVAVLGPNEAQNRFERLFQRFMGACAGADRPLVLFLDDLQWADAASLRLIHVLYANPEQTHLLGIGSYRDNEVNALHPLTHCIEALSALLPIERIELEPLAQTDVEALLRDTFVHRIEAIEPLAGLVLQKTSGNPFFIGQFLDAAKRDGLLSFDPARCAWTWQLEAIEAASATSNVVDLVLAKLHRLDAGARNALKFAACVGYRFDSQYVASVSGVAGNVVAHGLWQAANEGFVVPLDKGYRFASRHLEAGDTIGAAYRFTHDRVQQAAYALIPEAERGPVHLRIGRQLLCLAGPDGVGDDAVFEVAGALNLGRQHITDAAEKRQLAKLDLRAAARARAAGAPATACEFADLALELLGADPFAEDHDTAHAVHLIRAECAYVASDEPKAFASIEAVKSHGRTLLERIPAWNLQILLLMYQGRLAEATQTGIEALRMFGVSMPDPTDKAALGQAIGAEFRAVQRALAGRSIESLEHLPRMTAPEKLALAGTFADAIPASFQANPQLGTLMALEAVQLPLEHGTAPVSPYTYAQYGVVNTFVTGDYESSYRFGLLSMRLSERPEYKATRASVHFVFGAFHSPWRRPLAESVEHLRTGALVAFDAGDQRYFGSCVSFCSAHRLYAGEPLALLAADLPGYMRALAANNAVIPLGCVTVLQQTIASLMGETSSFGSMDSDTFAEGKVETSAPSPTTTQFGVGKAMLRYLAGKPLEALDACERFQPAPGFFYNAEHKLYRALALSELARTAEGAARAALVKRLADDIAAHASWEASCPETFSFRHRLLQAEFAALEGQVEQAMQLYEDAIAQATLHGSLPLTALCNELCGRFHHAAGRRKVARTYLTEARYHYERWGAAGKAAFMSQQYTEIDLASPVREVGQSTPRTGTHPRNATELGMDVGLDLMSAMRASQAIASELVLERLIQRLLRILVENAGAQRGFLILRDGAELELTAALSVDPDRVELGLREAIDSTSRLSAAVVQFVARSKEAVVLDDASRAQQFARDERLKARGTCSLLCMPLLHQGELAAILYLENAAVVGAFTPARVERLQFLGAHAAVAIENAKLYGQVQAATRRLAEANDTLEQKVRERTAELVGRNADMRRVLDNVTQGLISIDLEGRMTAEHSAIAERWFGELPAGKPFVDHIAPLNPKFGDTFAIAFQNIVDGFLLLDLALDQLPARLNRDDREYRVSYSPIKADDRLTGMLVVFDDVTEELRHAREEAEQKEQLALCQRLGRDRSGLISFFAEGDELLGELSVGADLALHKRALHTLKGNAAMMGLTLLAERCHSAEDALAAEVPTEDAVTPVRERWQALLRTLNMLLGTQRGEVVEVSRADLERVLRGVRAGAPAAEVSVAIERFLLEPLQRPLERLGEHARLIADRFGKAEAAVVVSDGAIFADPEKGRALWSVLVHVVRNAVDHGFETSAERRGLGKPPQNNLRLWARLDAGDLLLDISDDGRGIDWQGVRAVCAQRGLRSETRDDLVAALFAPNLSTRSEVTSTSGRGVGLEAVQRDVQALGGTISVDSETGNGCTFRLRVPAQALGAVVHDLEYTRKARRSSPPGRESTVS